MVTSFTEWNSGLYLSHHGIKGQKWGVRRFQNPDGTLTRAGQRRIARKSGSGYLNPSNKDRKKGKTKERDSVAKQYSEEYWKKVEKGMSTHTPSREGHMLWNKYKNQYSKATLKDLKMKDSQKARRDVANILKQIDPNYKYQTDYDPNRSKAFAERKAEIAHPVITKAKRKAKKMKQAADFFVTAKKVVAG